MDPRETAGPVLQELLGAHAVLPEQFWGLMKGSGVCGERALMWAVLTDGIECYRQNVRATSAEKQVAFKEAESWIFRTDWDWPFSFVNLCEVFGLNPAALRGALAPRKSGPPQRVYRRQRFRPATLHAA
jgi:hypothetical protein